MRQRRADELPTVLSADVAALRLRMDNQLATAELLAQDDMLRPPVYAVSQWLIAKPTSIDFVTSQKTFPNTNSFRPGRPDYLRRGAGISSVLDYIEASSPDNLEDHRPMPMLRRRGKADLGPSGSLLLQRPRWACLFAVPASDVYFFGVSAGKSDRTSPARGADFERPRAFCTWEHEIVNLRWPRTGGYAAGLGSWRTMKFTALCSR